MKEVVFITGAGALSGSWEPVQRVFAKVFGLKMDSDMINTWFAREIYQLRFFAKHNDEEGKKLLDNHLRFVDLIKRELSDELKGAILSKEMKVRPALTSQMEYYHNSSDYEISMLINTNWDWVVDLELKRILNGKKPFPKVVHIHGRWDLPDFMYLPTEIIDEPYRKHNDKIAVGKEHLKTMEKLKKCNVLVLVGISLNPMDAELTYLLSASISSNSQLDQILIVDPNHDIVTKRLMVYLNTEVGKKIQWSYLDPTK